VATDSADSAKYDRDKAIAALSSLAELAQASVSGVMLITAKKNKPPEVSQLSTTDRVLPSLNDVVRNAALSITDCELIDYGPATTTADGQVMWLPTSEVPLMQAIVDESADLAGMPVFDPDRTKLDLLRLAAMQATGNTTSAVFVQALGKNQIVAQSSRIGFIIRTGIIDLPPDGDNILLLSRDIAAISVAGIVFFRNRAAFDRLFGYLEEAREQAEATFRSVTSTLRIKGYDEMATAVSGDTHMMGKIASIQQKLDKYPQYKDALTMTNILKFITDHPECAIEVSGIGNTAELVYRNDPQHRFKILKLLDDDYLMSELTTFEYEANSKGFPIK